DLFGDKTDAVLKAAQKMLPGEENWIARGQEEPTRKVIGPESDELIDAPATRETADMPVAGGTRLQFHSQSVYENPATAVGKKGFKSAAAQALDKAPAGARWASFDEVGMDHPQAQKRLLQMRDELMDERKNPVPPSLAEAHATAEDYVRNNLGMLVSETAENRLQLTADEIGTVRHDSHNYSRSKAKLQTKGDVGHDIDAVKLTDMMRARDQEAGRTIPADIVGRRTSEARYFVDGLAALTDFIGKPLDIPDDTIISKTGMTWGEARTEALRAQKEAPSTARDVMYEQALGDLTPRELRDRIAGFRDSITEASRMLHALDVAGVSTREKAETKTLLIRLREAERKFSTELGRQTANDEPLSIEKDPRTKRVAKLEEQLDKLGDPSKDTPALRRTRERLMSEIEVLEEEMLRQGSMAPAETERDPFGPARQGGRDLGSGTVTAKGKGLDAEVEIEGAQPHAINPQRDELQGPAGALSPPGRRARGAKELPQDPRLAGQEFPEVPPSPKAVAAKKAAFVEKARSGDEELQGQLRESGDYKGLQRAAEALFDEDSPGARATLDTINERLSELNEDPDVAYNSLTQKRDATPVDPAATGPRNLKAAFDHIKKTLGNSVDIDLNSKIPFAGDFRRLLDAHGGVEDVIRVSMHALNPLSTAHHESMHGFFQKIADHGSQDINEVLRKAGNSPPTMLQLREFLKHSPEALKQLDDPEERAAYM
ncbi:MAG TPA: hypothetical protein VLC09_00440, partial [Polyangiaceae bacterium]|nr:hypothetical protein [Polyangiaceae bacterium]